MHGKNLMRRRETMRFVPRGYSADSAFCEYIMGFKRKCSGQQMSCCEVLVHEIDSTRAVGLEEKDI